MIVAARIMDYLLLLPGAEDLCMHDVDLTSQGSLLLIALRLTKEESALCVPDSSISVSGNYI